MTDPMRQMQDQVGALSDTVTALGSTVNHVSNRAVALQMRFVAGPGSIPLGQTRDIAVTWPKPMTVDGYFVVATPTDPTATAKVEITTVSTTAAAAVIRVRALQAVTLTTSILVLAQTLKQSSA